MWVEWHNKFKLADEELKLGKYSESEKSLSAALSIACTIIAVFSCIRVFSTNLVFARRDPPTVVLAMVAIIIVFGVAYYFFDVLAKNLSQIEQ